MIHRKVGVIALAWLIAAGAAAADKPALLASATPDQLRQLAQAVNSVPPTLKVDVTAANRTVVEYLITLMCVQDDNATKGLVDRFVGSRDTTMFNGWSGALSPGKRMKHHDMVGCLNVERILNWRRITPNEFAFTVVFTAPDSLESYRWPTTMHREPDGMWLVAG